jgi:hypothetical protein
MALPPLAGALVDEGGVAADDQPLAGKSDEPISARSCSSNSEDWNGDEGETPAPPAPDGLTDLPPILPWWGLQPWRALTAPTDPVEDGIRYRDLIT